MNGDDDIDDLGELTKAGKPKKKEKKEKKEKPKKKDKKVEKKKAAGDKIAPEIGAEAGSDGSAHAEAPPSPNTAKAIAKAQEEAEALAEEEAELAAFMDDDVDYDDLQEEEEDDGGRKEGEQWVPTDEEAKARKDRESKMTPQELADTADEWSEHVDPMTENVYWLHDETLELSMMMPAALKMRITLREEEDKNKKDMADAIARMTKSAGASATKAKAGFKKKR